jgi:hypothetical protein
VWTGVDGIEQCESLPSGRAPIRIASGPQNDGCTCVGTTAGQCPPLPVGPFATVNDVGEVDKWLWTSYFDTIDAPSGGTGNCVNSSVDYDTPTGVRDSVTQYCEAYDGPPLRSCGSGLFQSNLTAAPTRYTTAKVEGGYSGGNTGPFGAGELSLYRSIGRKVAYDFDDDFFTLPPSCAGK